MDRERTIGRLVFLPVVCHGRASEDHGKEECTQTHLSLLLNVSMPGSLRIQGIEDQQEPAAWLITVVWQCLEAWQSRYWITRSARFINVAGMVMPSALAVFRLMTSSNLVGCSTGRSAGFVPWRICLTYEAARRYKAP